MQKIKILILITLIIGIPRLAQCDEIQNKITINGVTCWYTWEQGQLIRKCDNEPEATQTTKNTLLPITTPINNQEEINKDEPNNSFPFVYFGIALFIGYLIGNKRKLEGTDYIQNQAELMVREELNKLDKNKYCIIHDITLPTEQGTAQIDHIVFSEYGIFVIETKGYQGWIFGKEEDRRWMQVFKNGKKFPFPSPVIQNANHIKHIAKISNTPIFTMKSIIVFTDPDTELKTILPNYVLKLEEINSHIKNWKQNTVNKKCLYEAIGCVEFNRKERSIKTNNEHIAYIDKRFKRKNNTI